MSPALESTLPNLLAFCRSFERGSFTAAAKDLQVTPAAVSRSVARLEQGLGASLFRRTTRQLRATEKGCAYYEKCAAALLLLQDAEFAVTEDSRTPRGVVRLSVPTTYGLHQLLPRLGHFRGRYPHLELEIQVSNQNIDFLREGFDLAIRMGAVSGAGLVARKLGDFSLGTFASPAYVRKHGAPERVDQLCDHDCIAFVMPRTGRVLPWSFAKPASEFVPNAALRCVEDPNACLALCRAGAGVAQGYDFMVAAELRRGDLVPVLRAHAGRTRRFSLVYPKEARQSSAVRAVIDLVLEKAA
jgi:DNA-binding transcriptional LysR family regulator